MIGRRDTLESSTLAQIISDFYKSRYCSTNRESDEYDNIVTNDEDED